MSTQERTTNKAESYTSVKNLKRTDDTLPYRFVGTYEYTNALDSFTRLLKISTPEQVEVYDRVLNERPEFTFFNGVSTAFRSKPDLRKANPFERQTFYDRFQKKGLAWMMALARVELCATESLYGKSEFPFESTINSEFDLLPYLQILADDAAAHIKSLAQEPGFVQVTKDGRRIDTWTLAYLRRLKLIRDMLTTLDRAGNPAVRAEIKPLDKKLEDYEVGLMTEVLLQTQPVTSVRRSQKVDRYGKKLKLKSSKSTITNCEEIVDRYKKKSSTGGSSSGSGSESGSPGSSYDVRHQG